MYSMRHFQTGNPFVIGLFSAPNAATSDLNQIGVCMPRDQHPEVPQVPRCPPRLLRVPRGRDTRPSPSPGPPALWTGAVTRDVLRLGAGDIRVKQAAVFAVACCAPRDFEKEAGAQGARREASDPDLSSGAFLLFDGSRWAQAGARPPVPSCCKRASLGAGVCSQRSRPLGWPGAPWGHTASAAGEFAPRAGQRHRTRFYFRKKSERGSGRPSAAAD